jgi:hypothetical protein
MISVTCFIAVNVITVRMHARDTTEQYKMHDIMEREPADTFDNWYRERDRTSTGNYTFKMVIDEINSIYRENGEKCYEQQ